jgi:hypothetical protein
LYVNDHVSGRVNVHDGDDPCLSPHALFIE